MDVSTVAHARHDYCSPIGRDTVQTVVSAIDLSEPAYCVDYGCGKGQLLLDVLQAYRNATGTGWDANEQFIREARERAARTGLQSRAAFEAKRIDASSAQAECDLAICFGSTHIFGGFGQTVDVLARALRRGGKVLLADGYWKRKPSPEYLHAFYNSAESDLLYMPQMLDTLSAAGLGAPYILTSSDREWEQYEGLWSAQLEAASYSVEDPQTAQAMRERAQKSRDNYWIHGGRETLGYAIVLAAKL